MARYPLFIDDPRLSAALDAASLSALAELSRALPVLTGEECAALQQQLRTHLASLLTDTPGVGAAADSLPLVHGPDAFGDCFDLDTLPLARRGTGYAVQLLDTDTLLDRSSSTFLAVRDSRLDGLFPTFETAYAAARQWLTGHQATTEDFPLAIVPARYDEEMGRHILIYGVLKQHP